MPYILGLDEIEERAVRKEAQARRTLTCINYAFVLFVFVCIGVNYLGQIGNVWLCRHIRPLQGLPYLVLAGILIYSMCKVKALAKCVSDQLYPRRMLLLLHAFMFISYGL